jgi:hypothetical protein
MLVTLVQLVQLVQHLVAGLLVRVAVRHFPQHFGDHVVYRGSHWLGVGDHRFLGLSSVRSLMLQPFLEHLREALPRFVGGEPVDNLTSLVHVSPS